MFTINIQLKVNMNCTKILKQYFLCNKKNGKVTFFEKKTEYNFYITYKFN